MELEFLLWLQKYHHPILDLLFYTSSKIIDYGWIWFGIILFTLWFKPIRKYARCIGLGIACEFITVSLLIKPMVQRLRPCMVRAIVDCPKEFSFPSGHSAFVMVLASLAYFQKWQYRFWIYGFASVVIVSRLYLFVHYPSDVLFGSIVGWLIGYGVYQIDRHFFQKELAYEDTNLA